MRVTRFLRFVRELVALALALDKYLYMILYNLKEFMYRYLYAFSDT